MLLSIVGGLHSSLQSHQCLLPTPFPGFWKLKLLRVLPPCLSLDPRSQGLVLSSHLLGAFFTALSYSPGGLDLLSRLCLMTPTLISLAPDPLTQRPT